MADDEAKKEESTQNGEKEKVIREYLRTVEEIEVFNRIGKTLTSTLDTKVVLQKVMKHISNLFKPDRWSLMLVDEKLMELFFEIYVGKGASRIRSTRIDIGEGIAGWVAKNGSPMRVMDVSKEPRTSDKIKSLFQLTTHSVVCVPLKVRNKVLGVIELIYEPNTEPISDHGVMILTTLADYAAISLENARIYAKIQEISVVDDVTGLYNSRYMHDILEMEIDRARRYESNLSIVFMDLDYFKNVNDTYGHLVGSRLLREIGDVMKQKIRKVDYLCRYGGDEFVLILPNTSKTGAFKVARRIQDAVNEHIFLGDEGLDVNMTSSYGVASFPEDANTKDALIHRGDEAMYKIKNTTRDDIGMA